MKARPGVGSHFPLGFITTQERKKKKRTIDACLMIGECPIKLEDILSGTNIPRDVIPSTKSCDNHGGWASC